MKTTKKHFKIFKRECRKWIEILGLKDWEFSFHHAEVPGFRNASSEYHITDRYADIYLFPKLHRQKATEKVVRMLAFHEICEVVLGPLYVNAIERHVSRAEINESTHTVIVILQNVLYPKY